MIAMVRMVFMASHRLEVVWKDQHIIYKGFMNIALAHYGH